MDDYPSSTKYSEDPSYIVPSAPPQQPSLSYPITTTSQLDRAPWPPPSLGLNSHSPVEWSSGLCDCCQDFSSCCLTCCCPCVAFGRIAEIVDRGSTCKFLLFSHILMYYYFVGCLTCCCPCVAFGRIAEIVDRGSTSCGVSGALYALLLFATGCSCFYSCFYRSKMRGQYFLEERPCTDCCVHCCCEGCALCQEYRELKNLGFDMSIGWHGNMERQKRDTTKVPPTMHKRMDK